MMEHLFSIYICILYVRIIDNIYVETPHMNLSDHERETKVHFTDSMENGINKDDKSLKKLNKYACASVIIAAVITLIHGYGEVLLLSIIAYS